jgi:thiol peroxidase
MERTGLFKFAGKDATIVGSDIVVGQIAPEFTAQANDWSTIQALQSTHGKVRIIGSLPSLNTSVCDRETRKFNEEAAALGSEIAILMLSMDLPFTQKNWCAAAGVDKVMTLSDHMDGNFGEKYGVLLKEPRIHRRAVFVVDSNNSVVYAAYMPVLGEEPNYSEVLAAAKACLVK